MLVMFPIASFLYSKYCLLHLNLLQHVNIKIVLKYCIEILLPI